MNIEQNNLIEKLGWLELPQEKQEYLIERTGGIVFKKIIARFLEVMEDEQKDTFLNLLEKEDVGENEIRDFVRNIIPNADELVREEVEEFLKDSNNIMDQI